MEEQKPEVGEYWLIRAQGAKYRHRWGIVRIVPANVEEEDEVRVRLVETTSMNLSRKVNQLVDVHKDSFEAQLLGYLEPDLRERAPTQEGMEFEGESADPEGDAFLEMLFESE